MDDSEAQSSTLLRWLEFHGFNVEIAPTCYCRIPVKLGMLDSRRDPIRFTECHAQFLQFLRHFIGFSEKVHVWTRQEGATEQGDLFGTNNALGRIALVDHFVIFKRYIERIALAASTRWPAKRAPVLRHVALDLLRWALVCCVNNIYMVLDHGAIGTSSEISPTCT